MRAVSFRQVRPPFLGSILLVTLALTSCSSREKVADQASAPAVGAAVGPALAPASGAGKGTGLVPARAASVPLLPESSKASTVDSRYQALAQAVRDSGAKNGQVQEEASRLLGTNPYDPVALNTLALIHFKQGRTGAAKMLLNRALEKSPHQAAALHNNLGLALMDEGLQDAAILEFKKALALDDRHPEALANLGTIYASAGEFTRALPMLKVAYEANRANVAIANNYAVALRVNKDIEGARKVYDETLKLHSRDVNTLVNYATLLIEFLNRPKDGLDLVYRVKFIETQRKDVLARANALEKRAKSELK